YQSCKTRIAGNSEFIAKYFQLIHERVFIPGGRILSNSGTDTKNLMNCFVLPVGDSRQEIFTQNWFKGKTKEESAIIAGYAPKWAFTIASRLSRNVKVLARYNELQTQASNDIVLNFEQRQNILSEIASGNLLDYQEVGDPSVQYFLCLGRTSSSKDPDKIGISVAEAFRHNEPLINRALTRMGEAVELLVRKRLTLEVPESFVPETEIVNKPGEDNQPQPKTYKFDADKATALPAGSKVIDPFANVADVFGAMPYIQTLMQIMGQHGVSPIFKGDPPGAASSGFNSNSLFMMAKSQFQYLVDSYSGCLVSLIDWLEGQLVTRARQEIWVDDMSLKPSDIKEWPATINVDIDPLLPQNLIAEGQFYDRMHTQGHITRRTFLEKGLRMDQPEAEMRARMFQDLQEMMKPALYEDVLQTVGVLPPPQPQLVDPQGNPIQSTNGGPGGGGIPAASQGSQAAIVEMLQSMGGRTRQGQPRQPPEISGSTPGLEQL
ncbi:hypothetical protein LCGC14_1075260, partial [marine sediment metagenome]